MKCDQKTINEIPLRSIHYCTLHTLHTLTNILSESQDVLAIRYLLDIGHEFTIRVVSIIKFHNEWKWTVERTIKAKSEKSLIHWFFSKFIDKQWWTIFHFEPQKWPMAECNYECTLKCGKNCESITFFFKLMPVINDDNGAKECVMPSGSYIKLHSKLKGLYFVC